MWTVRRMRQQLPTKLIDGFHSSCLTMTSYIILMKDDPDED